MRRILGVMTVVLGTFALASAAQARDYISIVGSSTVYPFATVVAEHYANSTQFPAPVIESTGSGGGLQLFCSGIGVQHPDITNASRAIKDSEIERCRQNGIQKPIEFKIGYDGIVIGSSVEATPLDLTLRDLFLALAKNVPDGNGGLVPNPNKTWGDVRSDLPNRPIEVMGPPPTSGTRDAFAELGLEGGCKTFDWIKALEDEDKNRYKEICHTVRSDGAYVEAGENDSLIVSKLTEDTNRVGIFGFSFLDQNRSVIQGNSIRGFDPTFENIASGDYPISRGLYFYVKKEHAGVIPGVMQYLEEFTSEDAIGKYGYLAEKGLIPGSESEREALRSKLGELKAMLRK